MHERSSDVHRLQPLGAPGAPPDPAARRGGDLDPRRACAPRAGDEVASGAVTTPRDARAPDLRRRVRRLARALVELRSRPTSSWQAVDRLGLDSVVGHPLHARRRRHRRDDDPAHDASSCCSRSAAAGRAFAREAHSYYALLLVLTTGMLGVFMALDLFLFYVMWEVMLVPMYFIVGIWGGERRIYASLKFFIYTMIGSLLMLVAILYLGLASRNPATGIAELQLRLRPARTRPSRRRPRSGCSAPSSSRSR